MRPVLAVLPLLALGCAGPQTFDDLDRDRDGLLTPSEAEEVVRLADRDGDAVVSQAEFRDYQSWRNSRQEDAPRELLAGNREPEEAAAAIPAITPPAPADPERTRAAREVYLTGVGLLTAKPPKVEEAIREFQHAVSLDPGFYKAHFKLGICYYHQGHYDLEIFEYRKCLTLNRYYTPAWLNLGHAHLAKDELEQARKAYRQVLELEPNHSIALYNLALVEFDLQNSEESLRLFRGYLEVDASSEMAERARTYIDRLEQRAGQEGG